MEGGYSALSEPNVIQLAYTAEGVGSLLYEDKSIRVEQGDLFVLPLVQSGNAASGVEITGSRSLRCFRRMLAPSSLGLAAPLLPMRWKVQPRYEEEFEEFFTYSSSDDQTRLTAADPPELSLDWRKFLDGLLQEPLRADLRPFEEDDSPIRQALCVIGHRFMNPLSVAEISRHVAMSTRNFQRVFKKETGRSFVQLLQEVRIRHSCGLLQFTRLSVQAVAEAVGFNDMYHFYRLFRSRCGVTPAAFRGRNQGTAFSL